MYATNAVAQFDNHPIANNGLILSADNGILVDFVSNSSQFSLGVITVPDGHTQSIGGNIGVWRVHSPFRRPGALRITTTSSLPSTSQGIYTCTIPDSNSNRFIFNIGLYPTGFDGQSLLRIIHVILCCTTFSSNNSGSHYFQPDLQSCRSYSDL